MNETRNSAVLRDFTEYCQANPDQRFWQALRNWAEVGNFILATEDFGIAQHNLVRDTFYWEGKNK